MIVNIKNAAQSFKRTLDFFLNSSHFPTLFLTVAISGAALFFANITPASLPDSQTLLELERANDQYLQQLADQNEKAAPLPSSLGEEDQELLKGQAGTWPENYITTEGKLRPGDTFGNLLRRAEIPELERGQIIEALDGLLDFRSLRPGDRFSAILDPQGSLVEYRYHSGLLDIYRVSRDDSGYRAEKMAVSLERRTEVISGKIDSSLFAAFKPHGEHPRLLYAFADIFSSHIDFNLEIKSGDSFYMVVEKYFLDDRLAGYGQIISAGYRQVEGKYLEAFLYRGPDGEESYFNREGQEMGASFLRSPVPMARVSSGFTYRRLHPILNVVRPHLAVDLAAPTGTPVLATADGRVHFAGPNGGNGNFVVIEHGNGYRSSYAHLSGIKRGLRVGDKVKQKELIGYVGSTGLATGPHLCYRIQHQGKYIDPLSLRFRPRSQLRGEQLAAFQAHLAHTDELTGIIAEAKGEKRVLKVKNITIAPEERLSLR